MKIKMNKQGVLKGMGLLILLFGLGSAVFGEGKKEPEYTEGDFSYKEAGSLLSRGLIITKYTGSADQLVIPDRIKGLPVAAIGERAFYRCGSLTSVTIPGSVASIGEGAFAACWSLSSVSIPASVISIGERAFYGCGSLSSVSIPASVTSIGNHAFYGCWSLSSVFIPDSVTSIEAGAFAACWSLSSVSIPDSVISIGKEGFRECLSLTDITVDEGNPKYSSNEGVLFTKDQRTLMQFPGARSGSYTIPASVTAIGDYAFYGCKGLSSVAIPASVTAIGDYAFYGCEGLSSVAIPASVTSIGKEAFHGCWSLTSVAIPASVTSIEENAFSWCRSLTDITVDEGNPRYSSNEGILFTKDQRTLMQFPGARSGSYTIPASVTAIGDYAFYGCEGLSSVTIPGSVTAIGDYAFGESSLSSVTLSRRTQVGGNPFPERVKISYSD